MINILCACNESFLAHTATMLASVKTHTKSQFRVFLQHNSTNHIAIDALGHYLSGLGCEFTSIPMEDERFHGVTVNHHASFVNYYRLLAPEQLPDVHRAIYLDSDLIVRSDILRLWEFDLHGQPIAAAENPGFSDFDRLGMPADCKYFNSGVMVMDMDTIRANGLFRAALDYAIENSGSIRLWDQDALNAVFVNRWQPLPISWNVQTNLLVDTKLRAEYSEAIAKPDIVHFSGGGTKPWQRESHHPYEREYWRYRNMTPWAVSQKYLIRRRLHQLRGSFRSRFTAVFG